MTCEHKYTLVCNDAHSQWCEDCGAYREFSVGKWHPWLIPNTRPSDAQSGEWPEKKEFRHENQTREMDLSGEIKVTGTNITYDRFAEGWNACHDAFMKVLASGQKPSLFNVDGAYFNIKEPIPDDPKEFQAYVNRCIDQTIEKCKELSRPALSKKKIKQVLADKLKGLFSAGLFENFIDELAQAIHQELEK